jgi:NADPH-dependent ferric siderophore reductase
MSPDRLLDMVGQPGGPLADAALYHVEVTDTGPISEHVHRVVLSAPELAGFTFTAGQDLMFRVPRPDGQSLNRRYTMRRFDPAQAAVTVEVSLHANGPGTDWIRGSSVGDTIDVIGPRGKVTLRDGYDWHFFIADETGQPGALAMMESMPPTSQALALFEVDAPSDEQQPVGDALPPVEITWLHRLGQTVPGDAAPMLEAVAGITLPAGRGHAYISAETKVVRAIQRALEEKGLPSDQISPKAYWRRGLPNRENGEPSKED